MVFVFRLSHVVFALNAVVVLYLWSMCLIVVIGCVHMNWVSGLC